MRTKRRLLTLLFFLQLIGILFPLPFLLDSHRIRAGLYTVVDSPNLQDFSWAPWEAPLWYRSDSPERYRSFRAEAQTAVSGSKSELKRNLTLMAYTRSLGGDDPRRLIQADSIPRVRQLLKKGWRGNCAHYSWLLMAYLRSLGSDARIVGLDQTDGLGGNGHATVEVWLRSFEKWAVLDPLNNAVFLRNDVPLSLIEIRDLIYSDKASEIEIRQGSNPAVPKSELLLYYKNQIQNIHLDGAGNLISRYEHRYGPLGRLAPLFDKLPRYPRRALANLFGQGDLRIHYLDEHALPYHPVQHRILLRSWLFLWPSALVTASFLLVPRLKREKGHHVRT